MASGSRRARPIRCQKQKQKQKNNIKMRKIIILIAVMFAMATASQAQYAAYEVFTADTCDDTETITFTTSYSCDAYEYFAWGLDIDKLSGTQSMTVEIEESYDQGVTFWPIMEYVFGDASNDTTFRGTIKGTYMRVSCTGSGTMSSEVTSYFCKSKPR